MDILTVAHGNPSDPDAFDEHYRSVHEPLARQAPGLTSSTHESASPQDQDHRRTTSWRSYRSAAKRTCRSRYQSLANEEMVRTMCRQVDRGHSVGFASWFSETATYRFGNEEPLVGRAAVEAATANAVSSLPWLDHVVDQIATVGDQVFCRFAIEIEAPDQKPVSMPCVPSCG